MGKEMENNRRKWLETSVTEEGRGKGLDRDYIKVNVFLGCFFASICTFSSQGKWRPGGEGDKEVCSVFATYNYLNTDCVILH